LRIMPAQRFEVVTFAIDQPHRWSVGFGGVEGQQHPVLREPGVVDVVAGAYQRDAGQVIGLVHARVDRRHASSTFAPLPRGQRALGAFSGRAEQPQLELPRIDAQHVDQRVSGCGWLRRGHRRRRTVDA
jgi:hypothetical protein